MADMQRRETDPTIGLTLSVVAPAYNEQESIGDFVAEMCEVLSATGAPYELICVDDGSSDDTWQTLLGLRARFPALRPAALEKNSGQSAALAAGVSIARGAFIGLIDADMQNDPADIAKMLHMLLERPDLDCLVGVRAERQDNWLRRISSRIANAVGEWITGEAIRDAGCAVKVCRAEFLKRVGFFRGAHRFLATLVKMEGGRVEELLVNHRPRQKGVSKYGSGLGRTFVALRDAFGVRWLMDRKIRYTLKPLQADWVEAVTESQRARQITRSLREPQSARPKQLATDLS
jgi:dolichol-phosphate mannosyltransferase